MMSISAQQTVGGEAEIIQIATLYPPLFYARASQKVGLCRKSIQGKVSHGLAFFVSMQK